MCWFVRFRINRKLKQLKTMQHYRALNLPSDAVLRKEIGLYYQVAKLYFSRHGKKKWPFAREASLACYRAAASLDDAYAQFVLGKAFLEEARFRTQLQEGGVLASERNEDDIKRLFAESHTFLLAAQALNHVQAKRLLGLCYIHGWGVDIDKEKGFDLIVASIEQENSWDRVQKIFIEMGINQPSFFSELFQHRKKPG